MRFGPVALAEAMGAILAHSVNLAGVRFKKGRLLGPEDIAALAAAGLAQVTVARLEPEDVAEDAAAARIARAIAPDPAALGLSLSAPFTGRANLFAAAGGVLRVDRAAIDALNSLDEAITLACLPDHARVVPRQMVATVKIIPFVAPGAAVAAAEALIEAPPIRLHPVTLAQATLILTRTPGMADKLVAKGADAVRLRLGALGVALAEPVVVAHEAAALAAALGAARGDLTLVLTASATSDRHDVGPAALVAAGGSLARLGMPVDPGNLLFLGDLAGRPVIGLPGCARSPALNGADWVIERVVCGLTPTAAEIAAMGVGGLLKEIPSRPQPRGGGHEAPTRPVVAAVLLAAGSSRRMGGRDKLLEPVAGEPLLTRVATRLAGSSVDEVVVVLRPDDPRRAALAGLGLRVVENPRAAEGMGASLACGVAAIRGDADAVLVALADMPDLGPGDYDRLIAAFDPAEGRAIVRATAAAGRPGHPVLFGARFFEALRALSGDRGARAVIDQDPDFVVDVALGAAAETDLDTPEAWAAWRARATPVPPSV